MPAAGHQGKGSSLGGLNACPPEDRLEIDHSQHASCVVGPPSVLQCNNNNNSPEVECLLCPRAALYYVGGMQEGPLFAGIYSWSLGNWDWRRRGWLAAGGLTPNTRYTTRFSLRFNFWHPQLKDSQIDGDDP